jgi:hypothetical protein
MATILELAREVRHQLVSRATGCLTVSYGDGEVSIEMFEGVIVTPRDRFLSCFRKDPEDFRFQITEVQVPDNISSSGASLLIEALESINETTLLRVWAPYSNWRISFRDDHEIHNTLIKQHLASSVVRLRRLMRFAVFGGLKLEPPLKKPIPGEADRIRLWSQAGEWWKILGISDQASVAEIKAAFRHLALKFHPDRLEGTTESRERERAVAAFRDVHKAYKQALAKRRAKPIAVSAAQQAPVVEAQQSEWRSTKATAKPRFFRRLYDLIMVQVRLMSQ